MEHLAHFGLSRDPFRNEPQLDFLYESASHREALRRLLRCVNQGKELSLLVGEVGTGTTTVARSLFEELAQEAFEAGLIVLSRGVEPEWLRAGIARQLGVEEPASDRAEGVRQLYEQLAVIHEEGRRAVILLDEAQALKESEALAELRSLLNFEYEERRLLSLVLIGSPELEEVLSREPGLLGRVDVRVQLSPMDESDAQQYLAHRIRLVGGDPVILAPVAAMIAERASGIPRRLNALADNALFEAFLAGRKQVTPEDVEAAARELPWAKESAQLVESEADQAAGSASRADPEPGLPEAAIGAAATAGVSTAAGDAFAAEPAGLDSAEPGRVEPESPTMILSAGDPLALDDAVDAIFEGGQAAPADHLDPLAPGPERAPDLDTSVVAPEETTPGAWRTAEPLEELEVPAPDDDELDGLFVDLVDEA